jgi:hypothetical protein
VSADVRNLHALWDSGAGNWPIEKDPANPTDLYSEEWVAVAGWQWRLGGSVAVWLGNSVAVWLGGSVVVLLGF